MTLYKSVFLHLKHKEHRKGGKLEKGVRHGPREQMPQKKGEQLLEACIYKKHQVHLESILAK